MFDAAFDELDNNDSVGVDLLNGDAASLSFDMKLASSAVLDSDAARGNAESLSLTATNGVW